MCLLMRGRIFRELRALRILLAKSVSHGVQKRDDRTGQVHFRLALHRAGTER